MSRCSDPDLRVAAHWALVLRDPTADHEQIKSALSWLERSAENEAAFARVNKFLDACDNIAAHREIWASPERSNAFRANSRLLAIAASFLLVLVTSVALTGHLIWQGQQTPPRAMHFSSAAGEFKTIALPDHSTLLLTGQSEITVEFMSRERRLNLVRGEAFFDVAADRSRPFVVQSGPGTATAVGTEFNVHRDGGGTVVTVIHGRVVVDSTGPAKRWRASLDPSMQVDYASSGTMSTIRRVDLDTILARRSGTLTFSGQPLAQVVSGINRYSREPVVLVDPDIGSIPITGSVNASRIYEWLTAFDKGLGISVTRDEKGLLLRKQRPSR
jgi:transmembrane sensor